MVCSNASRAHLWIEDKAFLRAFLKWEALAPAWQAPRKLAPLQGSPILTMLTGSSSERKRHLQASGGRARATVWDLLTEVTQDGGGQQCAPHVSHLHGLHRVGTEVRKKGHGC